MLECAFTGRLGADPELKTSKTGSLYFSISIAVTSSDETTWIRVAVFGDRAAELAPELHKGDAVYCEGRLQIERYTARDGQERVGFSVAASTLGPAKIGRRKPAKEKGPGGAGTNITSSDITSSAGSGTEADPDLNDEIPF
jgi:single-strand DNA-binding protein